MGDYIRWAPPYYGEDEQQGLGTRSALYLSLNRGKRSIRLDLKSEAGREALLRLVESYDVVLDGFRPGVLDRLGRRLRAAARGQPGDRLLRDHRLRPGRPQRAARRPRHELPRPDRDCSASPAQKDGPPVSSAGQIADVGGGLMAAFGVMAALNESRRSGEGQMVDVSMADGALSWLAMVAGRYFCDGEVPRRGESSSPAVCSVTSPTRPPTAGSPAGRWSRSSGLPSATASGGRICSRSSSRRPAPTPGARSPRSSAPAAARNGSASTTSTTAASSRSSTSTRRSTPSWSASARWWSRWSSPGSARSASSACR